MKGFMNHSYLILCYFCALPEILPERKNEEHLENKIPKKE